MKERIYTFVRLLFYKVLRGPYQRIKYFQSETIIKRRAGDMEVFTDIYKKKLWRSSESASGTGSTLSNTIQIRNTLPKFFERHGIHSVLDLPCGDFNWMKTVDIGGIEYIGADLVDALVMKNKKYERKNVKFVTLNLIKDELPQSDLILVRDCLVHFSYQDIRRAMANIRRSESTYLLTTSFKGHMENKDIETGFWRPINLQGPPFTFPEPLEALDDFGPGLFKDKSLLLWRVKDLPNDWS